METGCFDLKHMRLGNIEVRQIESDKYSHEIVRWEPNPHYGKESNYTYNEDTGFYDDESGHMHFDPNCFKHPETCYVLAWITDDKEHDVHSVGKRPWELDDDDYRCLCEILKVLFREN